MGDVFLGYYLTMVRTTGNLTETRDWNRVFRTVDDGRNSSKRKVENRFTVRNGSALVIGSPVVFDL
jgi:hypothetical protein